MYARNIADDFCPLFFAFLNVVPIGESASDQVRQAFPA